MGNEIRSKLRKGDDDDADEAKAKVDNTEKTPGDTSPHSKQHDLAGKVALVTGAAKGCGLWFAEALIQRKAKVILTDVLEEKGVEETEDLNRKYGQGSAIFVGGDLRKEETIDKVFAAIQETTGSFSIAVNNAGIGGRASLDRIDEAFEINTTVPVKITERAMAMMRKDQGGPGGVIVNIGSIAGLVTTGGVARVYQATKHAINAYTKATATGLSGEEGVRLVCLNPTYVRTDMVEFYVREFDKGNPEVVSAVEKFGGWVTWENLVCAFLEVVENDSLPQGAIVKIGSAGTTYVNTAVEQTPTDW